MIESILIVSAVLITASISAVIIMFKTKQLKEMRMKIIKNDTRMKYCVSCYVGNIPKGKETICDFCMKKEYFR